MHIVALDGPERTGKSTQLKMLGDYLAGKGFIVYTSHTSLLEQKDVTNMKLSVEARFFAYMAALMEVTIKIRGVEADYVLLDRYLLTHLIYGKKYWPPVFSTYNTLFTTHLLDMLKGIQFTTLCFLYPWMKDKSYEPDLIACFSNAELPGIKKVTLQASKLEVHEHIKKLLQV